MTERELYFLWNVVFSEVIPGSVEFLDVRGDVSVLGLWKSHLGCRPHQEELKS